MPLKIAMIGAGSIGFTRRLMGDLLTVPEFAAFTGIHCEDAWIPHAFRIYGKRCC